MNNEHNFIVNSLNSMEWSIFFENEKTRKSMYEGFADSLINDPVKMKKFLETSIVFDKNGNLREIYK